MTTTLYALAFVSWFCAVMAIRSFLHETQEVAHQREIDQAARDVAYMTAQKLAASVPPIYVAGQPFRYQRWLAQ